MNQVVLIGRVATELRDLSGRGAAFTIAVDRELSKEKAEEAKANGSPTADFITVTAWGRLSNVCMQYLHKGMRIAVSGRITTSASTKNGERRYYTGVTAQRIVFLESARGGTEVRGGRVSERAESGRASSKPSTAEMDPYDLTMDDFPF